MSILTIDTHQIITELKQAGLSDMQAEAITKLHRQAINDTLEQVKHDFDIVKLVTVKDLDARIRETELKFAKEIAESKAELIRWVVGVGVLQITLIVGLILKLIN